MTRSSLAFLLAILLLSAAASGLSHASRTWSGPAAPAERVYAGRYLGTVRVRIAGPVVLARASGDTRADAP